MSNHRRLIEQVQAQWTEGVFASEDAIPGESPKIKMFTDIAFDAWSDFEYACKLKTRDRFYPIWLRAAEHAMKLALIVSDGDYIEHITVLWAIEFVTKCINEFLGESYSNVTENENDRLYLKMLAVVASKNDTGISKSDLSSRFHKYLNFKETMQTLVDTRAAEIYRTTSSHGRVSEKLRITPEGLQKAQEYLLSLEQQKNPT